MASTACSKKIVEEDDGWVDKKEKKKAVVTGGRTVAELGPSDQRVQADEEESVEERMQREEAKKAIHWARKNAKEKEKEKQKEPEKPVDTGPKLFMGSRLRAAKQGGASGQSTDFRSETAFPTLGGGPPR